MQPAPYNLLPFIARSGRKRIHALYLSVKGSMQVQLGQLEQ